MHYHGQSNNFSISQSGTGTLTTAGPGGLFSLSELSLSGGRVNPNGGEVRLDNIGVFNGTIFGPGKIVVGIYGPSTAFLNGDFTTAADFTITRGAALTVFGGLDYQFR